MTSYRLKKNTEGKSTNVTRSAVATASKKVRSRNMGASVNAESYIDPTKMEFFKKEQFYDRDLSNGRSNKYNGN